MNNNFFYGHAFFLTIMIITLHALLFIIVCNFYVSMTIFNKKLIIIIDVHVQCHCDWLYVLLILCTRDIYNIIHSEK